MRLLFSITFISIAVCCVNFFIGHKNEPQNVVNESSEVSSESSSQTEVEPTSQVEQKSESAVSNDVEVVNAPSPQIQVSANYSNLYPELCCSRPAKQITPNKTIFLTFDDGPSERTTEVLDILKSKGVKATFFVTGNATENGKALMRRIVDEGHTIGIHTYTHEFKQIYATVKSYLDDFNRIYTLVYETTGVKPTIFRFPGGSKNAFNKHNYRELIAEMTRRGFDYFDWNLSVGDAVSRTPTPTQKCISNVLSYSSKTPHGVVLMHDARPKHTTVEALPSIIDGLRSQGFTLDKLSHDINPAPYSLVKPYR